MNIDKILKQLINSRCILCCTIIIQWDVCAYIWFDNITNLFIFLKKKSKIQVNAKWCCLRHRQLYAFKRDRFIWIFLVHEVVDVFTLYYSHFRHQFVIFCDTYNCWNVTLILLYEMIFPSENASININTQRCGQGYIAVVSRVYNANIINKWL